MIRSVETVVGPLFILMTVQVCTPSLASSIVPLTTVFSPVMTSLSVSNLVAPLGSVVVILYVLSLPEKGMLNPCRCRLSG